VSTDEVLITDRASMRLARTQRRTV